MAPARQRRLRIGIVGGGSGSAVGRTHRLALRLSERYDLVAGAFDIDPQRGRAYAEEHFVPADRIYANVDELIAKEKARQDPVDIVSVLTPNNTHFEIAKKLVSAGFNVLCEKPMTTRREDADELVRLVQKNNTVFGVMYGYSGYPMISQARAMVQAGEIGRVRVINSEFAFGLPVNMTEDPKGHWRTKKGISGESAVVGMIGTHALYLATHISGLALKEVSADFQSFVPGRDLEDNAHMMLRFSDGATGMMWNSYIAAGVTNGLRIRFFGDEGGLEWDHDLPNQLTFFRLGRPREVITQASRVSNASAPEGFVECFAAIYRGVADAIEARISGGAPVSRGHHPDVTDGASGVRFVLASVESARRNGAWVSAG